MKLKMYVFGRGAGVLKEYPTEHKVNYEDGFHYFRSIYTTPGIYSYLINSLPQMANKGITNTGFETAVYSNESGTTTPPDGWYYFIADTHNPEREFRLLQGKIIGWYTRNGETNPGEDLETQPVSRMSIPCSVGRLGTVWMHPSDNQDRRRLLDKLPSESSNVSPTGDEVPVYAGPNNNAEPNGWLLFTADLTIGGDKVFKVVNGYLIGYIECRSGGPGSIG